MLSILLTIWFLHVAAMMSPGANVLLVSQLAASDRARGAVFAALGVTVGAAIWALCAVLGVNAVFQVFPGLRLALQVAGGLYLLYVPAGSGARVGLRWAKAARQSHRLPRSGWVF